MYAGKCAFYVFKNGYFVSSADTVCIHPSISSLTVIQTSECFQFVGMIDGEIRKFHGSERSFHKD